MNYTTLPIIRTKKLSDNYFEVVLKKKRELVYKPGDCVLLKDLGSDTYQPYFVASGLGEPWLRIIVRSSEVVERLKTSNKARIKIDSFNVFPSLMKAKKPVFVCSSVGVGPFFSYISTYPGEKLDLYIVGDIPNMSWANSYPQAIICKDVDDFKAKFKVKRRPEHYVCGPTEIAQAIKNTLSAEGIKNKKIKYIDFQ